ncbi:Alpha-2-HS-glycoprotein [Merluccius polli]|uniref:Alpha-2-HS-glycoprotein n=1 Tax=Merluccius polli TaxID=89951 RepID=A0AA47NRR7_MERPO|nr:Alpha-2-HS-glycoprotein [Merluccius polli]
MRGLVLLLSAVAALCGAAPAPPLEPVTCGGDQQETNAARFAMQHINENQNHGYKFKLAGVNSSKVEQEEQGCKITLQLSLQETTCHVVNPKHFEDCDVRSDAETVVKANCTVVLSLQNLVANVLSHKYDTLHTRCPDCPKLMPLNNFQIHQYVVDAVRQYNSDSSFIQNHFVLRDIGRTSASYISSMGMQNVTEFAMMETHCAIRTKVVPERCTPLCPDRAQYVICSSINGDSGSKLECKITKLTWGLASKSHAAPVRTITSCFPAFLKWRSRGQFSKLRSRGHLSKLRSRGQFSKLRSTYLVPRVSFQGALSLATPTTSALRGQ